MLRAPGLLPSHGLSPFGSMNDTLCTFHPGDTRWPSMSQMTQMSQMSQMAQMNGNPLSLPPTLPRQSLGPSLGPQVSVGNLGCAVTLGNGIGVTAPNNSLYSTGYGGTSSCSSPLSAGSPSPSVASAQMPCSMQDVGDGWRGTSIASLRRKALEHTVSMTGFR